MKCKAVLTWEDCVWFSTVSTATGEPVGCTLESGSFDALVERVKVAVLEMLELNFSYVGEVELSIEAKRKDNLRAISWKPRET